MRPTKNPYPRTVRIVIFRNGTDNLESFNDRVLAAVPWGCTLCEAWEGGPFAVTFTVVANSRGAAIDSGMALLRAAGLDVVRGEASGPIAKV
jgi:hypothetical protein